MFANAFKKFLVGALATEIFTQQTRWVGEGKTEEQQFVEMKRHMCNWVAQKRLLPPFHKRRAPWRDGGHGEGQLAAHRAGMGLRGCTPRCLDKARRFPPKGLYVGRPQRKDTGGGWGVIGQYRRHLRLHHSGVLVGSPRGGPHQMGADNTC